MAGGGSNLLTIGMATYDDFHGCWMTIRSLRAHHGRLGVDFDILVIDNAPKKCKRTEAVALANSARYFHRPDLVGTAAPRHALFEVARTPWVMCVDSHVLFDPGAILELVRYIRYEAGEDCRDMLTGPMVDDTGDGLSTHWRATTPPGLWGVWTKDIRVNDLQPFEIPANGLGCFAMRRDKWVGFHPMFRGYGGEEGYAHEKVRRAGGKVICLPGLRWNHKFRDLEAEPTKYPNTMADHCFNTLGGHAELGIVGPDIEKAVYDDFGRRIGADGTWNNVLAAVKRVDWAASKDRPRPLKILGLWYSDNSAPAKLLESSLATITAAAGSSRHDVRVGTCSIDPVGGNVFPWVKANHAGVEPGHGRILRQMSQAFHAVVKEGGWTPDVVCFLEHDVLYPPHYFDLHGNAHSAVPSAPVVSNLDYEGLNATGWLHVKERHEPMHQLSMKYEAMKANMGRASADCLRQGWAYLEPDAVKFDEHHAEVEAGLWVGALGAKPPAVVDSVLNLSGSKTYHHDLNDCLNVELSDDGAHPAPPVEKLEEWVKWVSDRTAAGKTVLVHCLGGVSRSGLVACAYLMAKHGVTREAAVAAIRRVRPQVAPRPAFWKLLEEYRVKIGATGNRIPERRADWVRLQPIGRFPAIHVNHPKRFTSHGEVCYHQTSAGRIDHSFWGDYRKWWPLEPSGCQTCGGGATTAPDGSAPPPMPTGAGFESMEAWYTADSLAKSDFNEHMATLRELADKCDHVTEVSTWLKPALTALAASKAKRVVSCVPGGPKPTWAAVQRFRPGDAFAGVAADVRRENSTESDGFPEESLEATDLLFLDTRHNGERVLRELKWYAPKVRKYIVIHTTAENTFGNVGEDGKPGVLPAIRAFLMDNREWTVIRRDENNHGLIVMSRVEDDKKTPPGVWKKALNFTKALAAHAVAGSVMADDETWAARLDVCMMCPSRAFDTCAECGCPVDKKTSWAEQECPANPPKWRSALTPLPVVPAG